MIPLLTIRRQFPKKKRVTDHCFYLNLDNQTVEEWHTSYNIKTMELLPKECGLSKISKARPFIINLHEMVEHPCNIMENKEAIIWYAAAVFDGII